MMDWWDWWITTAVALPVAAVVLALALLAKRRDAKIGLGLVGLVAIGLAVAAPLVMGGSGSGGGSAMSGERLTAAQFARRADANCRDLAKQPGYNFGKPAPTPAFARKLDVFLPEFHTALGAQARLRPPVMEQTTAGRWMNAMSAVGRDFEAMRNAAKRSDSSAFTAAGKRLSAHAGQSSKLSKELSQTYCFQG